MAGASLENTHLQLARRSKYFEAEFNNMLLKRRFHESQEWNWWLGWVLVSDAVLARSNVAARHSTKVPETHQKPVFKAGFGSDT